MSEKHFLSIVIYGHHPFVSPSSGGEVSGEERDFFEALSETWLPLLELFESLEMDGVPFRFALVLSPALSGMLQDALLLERYLAWLDRRIEFGKREQKRCADNEELRTLAEYYHARDCQRRAAITERYSLNLLEAFIRFQKLDRLELMITSATNAYFPFYTSAEEAIRAQIETSLIHHRKYFGKIPSGFWLPDLGWSRELGRCLSEYGFTYTLAEAHALVMGNPPAEAGSFYPVKTPSGLGVFGRDSGAQKELEQQGTDAGAFDGVYRSAEDAGFELSARTIKSFLGEGNSRSSTGYCYWTKGSEKKRAVYNRKLAEESARNAAKTFLDNRSAGLEAAGNHLENPISVCTIDAESFFRRWYEGTCFLEALMREIDSRHNPPSNAGRRAPLLSTPLDYLSEIKGSSIQTTEPGFSSGLQNGYAELLLDASNDWMYRHIFRSIQRMSEMTERFSGDTGLKERALNQAARELLLAQSTDLSKALNPQYQGRISRETAQQELEGSLRNFTTIYEALGSSHISTEWLTALERKHPFLPYINHRVFARKK